MKMRVKILLLVGTRPEAVKMAPVVMELRSRSLFDCWLCLTGQHREMSAQALEDFGLLPDRNLDVMTAEQSLAGLTAALLPALDALYSEEAPDMILVQGDTTTVMTAALAAFYRHIPVGHVEAGLRSFNRSAPFPEESNRKITGCLADLHFAPTETARANLLAEGVPADDVFVTGNTVIDALLQTAERIRGQDDLLPPPVRKAAAAGKKIIPVTAHRRETYEAGFEGICNGILAAGARRDDVFFVYPVHLNPRVRGPVFSLLGGQKNILLMDPVPYRPFVALMQAAYFVLTDSGGIQEEAPALGKPVLVMRGVTERPEGIAAGNALIVGTEADAVAAHIIRLLDDPALYARMSRARNPYGDGKSAARIANILEARLCDTGASLRHAR
jgi:UDP-N-acetylglucosamine 2-epimerase